MATQTNVGRIGIHLEPQFASRWVYLMRQVKSSASTTQGIEPPVVSGLTTTSTPALAASSLTHNFCTGGDESLVEYLANGMMSWFQPAGSESALGACLLLLQNRT